MHVYERYRPNGQADVNRLVREHPFAVLVSAADGAAPEATHVPVLLPDGHGVEAPLVGAVLRGHLGRANSHWSRLDGRQVLVVFGTSHAYVTPQTYDPGPTAPTLDYAAVHLTGRAEVLTDRAETLAVVEATVAEMETARPTQWDPSGSEELFQRILPGVVAFRIHVESQEAMFKLSQEKTPQVRARIRDDLMSGPRRHPDVVALLERSSGVVS